MTTNQPTRRPSPARQDKPDTSAAAQHAAVVAEISRRQIGTATIAPARHGQIAMTFENPGEAPRTVTLQPNADGKVTMQIGGYERTGTPEEIARVQGYQVRRPARIRQMGGASPNPAQQYG